MHPGFDTKNARRSDSLARAAGSVIESLESRQMLSIAQDDAGWSVITRPAGSNGKNVYVSSSTGSDSYDGTTGIHIDGTNHGPFATIAKGKSAMSDGHDDWLLLRRGDTWNESIGFWTKHGPSATDPMVISYYGTYDDPFLGETVVYDQSSFPQDSASLNLDPRPRINSGLSDGVSFLSGASNIAVDGLQFFPVSSNGGSSYDGTNSIGVTGLRAQLTGHDFLVEDCLFDGYKDNVVIGNPDTPVTNFTIRRSMMLDAYNHAGTHAQGLYASGTTVNLLIEQNVFDHNGWKSASDKTVFNHDMYINTGATGTVIQGNVVTRGSLRGTLLRAGGTVLNNFYDQNAVAIQVGNSASDVENNVILEGVDLPSLASGVGIDVAFSIPSVTIKGNIVAHDQSAYTYNLSGINLNGGTHQADVENNIVYDWRRAFIAGVSGGGNIIQNNTLEDFDGYHPIINYTGSGSTTFGNNSYYEPSADNATAFQDGNTRESFSAWKSNHGSDSSSTYGTLVPYIDPNRDMTTYNASLGQLATFSDWINAQRAQTREGNSLYNGWYQPNFDNSPPAYTAAAEIKHIKDGFSTSAVQQQAVQEVDITASDPSASEVGLDPGSFTVTRSTTTPGGLSLPLTVAFDLSGTAALNTDYTLNRTTITFPAVTDGSMTQTINPLIIVTPKADSLVEGDETVKISLRGDNSVLPQYKLGNNSTATVTIADSVTTVNVQASTPTAYEQDSVPGVFTFIRSGATDQPLTVTTEITGSATNPLLADANNSKDYDVSGVTDMSLFTDANQITHVYATVTFPVGANTVDVDIVPIDDGIPEGIDPVTGNPAPGDEDVGITILANNSAGYVPGVNSGADLSIVDPSAPTPPPDTGGGGGTTNPPPQGRGLYEAYINNQDNFLPTSTFANGVTGDQIQSQIASNAYGNVVFNQVDGRPGFDFTGSTGHPNTNSDHFSTLWTGQLQPQYGEVYTLSLTLDGDASARIWVENDAGHWKQIATTNDSDPSKVNYSDPGYFTHRIGDANDDSAVDTTDFTTMAQNFGQSGQNWANGDFNGDGTINALDFNAISSNFGTADPRPTKHTISGTVDFFEAGQRYNIVVEYSDKVGEAKIRLLWSSPSRTAQEVPLDRLYASSVATTGGVLAGATPSLFSTSPIDGASTDSVIS